MFKHTTRKLISGTVLAIVAMPSVAHARFDMNPPRQAPAQYQAASTTAPVTAVTTSSSGFQWADAGIGAAGMLVLLGAGGTASVARRRRLQNRSVH
jgi:hypothetical protein